MNCLQKNQFYLCKECLQLLNFKSRFYCFECQRKVNEKCPLKSHTKLINFAISFGEYENENLTKIVLLGKNESREILIDLSYFIVQEIDYYLKSLKDYFLIPVPITKRKLLQRGFNQAEILAEAISKLSNIPISKTLIKIKETKDQSELNFNERQENVKSVFDLKEKPPRKVILVDDIKTTGATLKECAQTLKKNGTKNIIALTILR